MPLAMQKISDDVTPETIESRAVAIGERIFDLSRSFSMKQLMSSEFWYSQFLKIADKDPRLKTQLFRFVDVLPMLQSFQQKREHLEEYLISSQVDRWPLSFKMLKQVFKLPLVDRAVVTSADWQVSQVAKMFIVGSTSEQALPRLQEARDKKLGFTLDLLGEAVLSEPEAVHYRQRYFELIEKFSRQRWLKQDVLDYSALGAIPTVNVSIKISALDADLNILAYEKTRERLVERLLPLLRKAKERNVFINLDMEQFAFKDLFRDVFKDILFHPEFKNYRHLGIVNQAYLTCTKDDIYDWVETAKRRGTPFTIRLVKGAYWDYEVIEARSNGWEVPVFTKKFESDGSFEECAKVLLDNYPHIELAIGSHNVRSIAFCLAYAEYKKIPSNAFEIQMLHGMADPFKRALTRMGYRVREYDPIGEMLPGLSYLVRRLLENSSNDSFLKQSFMGGTAVKDLLKAPRRGK